MAAGQKPAYKRSWKNLLLNKRYQLRFTLFMVGISALLMLGLGVWVMKEANEATTVAMARVRGEACPKVPEVIEVPQTPNEAPVPMNIDEPVPPAEGAPAEAPNPKKAAKKDNKKAEPAPEPEAPKPAKKEDGQAKVHAVKALWCTGDECKPELAQPLLVKVKNRDAYGKKELEDMASVDALRALTI